jgi:hypothetical protein
LEAEGAAVNFTDYYYDVLKIRYGSPFLAAQEIIDTATEVGPDPMGMPGFVRASNGINEIVYNPATGQVWHMMPIK